MSYGAWRALSRGAKLVGAEAKPRPQMMALVGVFVGVSFTLGILLAGAPTAALVRVCEVMR